MVVYAKILRKSVRVPATDVISRIPRSPQPLRLPAQPQHCIVVQINVTNYHYQNVRLFWLKDCVIACQANAIAHVTAVTPPRLAQQRRPTDAKARLTLCLWSNVRSCWLLTCVILFWSLVRALATVATPPPRPHRRVRHQHRLLAQHTVVQASATSYHCQSVRQYWLRGYVLACQVNAIVRVMVATPLRQPRLRRQAPARARRHIPLQRVRVP